MKTKVLYIESDSDIFHIGYVDLTNLLPCRKDRDTIVIREILKVTDVNELTTFAKNLLYFNRNHHLGLVDSPPTSIIFAPELIILEICLNALVTLLNFPPSEKLSGVRLRIPMIDGF